MLTDAELAAKPGGNPGDKWNDTDISDLRGNYPPNTFNSFPGWLKAKILKSKRGTDFAQYHNNDSPSQRNVSDTSSVQSEVAQLRAIIQASMVNMPMPPPPQSTNIVPPSDSTISTAGTRFGRGTHENENNKRPRRE